MFSVYILNSEKHVGNWNGHFILTPLRGQIASSIFCDKAAGVTITGQSGWIIWAPRLHEEAFTRRRMIQTEEEVEETCSNGFVHPYFHIPNHAFYVYHDLVWYWDWILCRSVIILLFGRQHRWETLFTDELITEGISNV